MTISEKVAYIKGLAEGMKIDDSKNEGKLFLAMLDVLTDMAEELEILDEDLDGMAEVVGEIEEIVEDIEEELFGDDYEDFGFDGDDLYEITCSKCDNTVAVDLSVIEDSIVNCPNCGEKIEFDIDFIGDCDCCGDDE